MVTRYEQVAIEISGLISRGILRPGDRLPLAQACSNTGLVAPSASLRRTCDSWAYPRSPAVGSTFEPRKCTGHPSPPYRRRVTAALGSTSLAWCLKCWRQSRTARSYHWDRPFQVPELLPLDKLNKIAAAAARHMPTWSSISDLTPGDADSAGSLASATSSRPCRSRRMTSSSPREPWKPSISASMP